MRNIWLSVFLLILLAGAFSGCDPMRKMAKSPNIADRDSAAKYYYEHRKYDQAVFLYEELLGIYRSTPRAEEIFYYYAYCRYYMGELITAAYYFEEFTKQFPRSEHKEEFSYLTAYCYYKLSDPWYLDQKYTVKAIEQMQLFITRYPNSEHAQEAQEIMTELRERLARKAFEQAALYHKIGYHKAGVQAFKNVIQEYPDSKFREETQYLLAVSAFKLAEISITSKKEERYEQAIELADKFSEKFSGSDYLKEVNSVKEKAEKGLSEIQEMERLEEEEKLFGKFRKNMKAAIETEEPESEKEAYAEAMEFHTELREKYPESKYLVEAEDLFREFDKKKEKESKQPKEGEN